MSDDGTDETEPQPNAVYAALLRARPKFKPLVKSGKNAHFKNSYATLADLYECCVDALASEGLLIVQTIHVLPSLHLTTAIVHAESGDSIEASLPISATANPQDRGSELTYARRYTVAPLLSLEGELDDDGETAVGRGQAKPLAQARPAVPAKPTAVSPNVAPPTSMPPGADGDIDNAPCPNCSGPMWDNREPSRGGKGKSPKRNPKQPDFVCRDKTGCVTAHDGTATPSVYWPGQWQKLVAEAGQVGSLVAMGAEEVAPIPEIGADGLPF